ncbi:MAG: DUF5916 domain-containing protein [Saprospiraceae bacterium]
MFFTRLTLSVAVLLCSPFIFSQNVIIDAHRLTGEINFDGRVNEVAWQDVPLTEFKMQVPEFGQEPTERSEVRLAYDDKYLYLSGKMYLSDSSLYRGTTFKRDAMDGTTDYFGMAIDSYNDNENALGFFTTPTGLRWDGTVANDAQADTDMSIDWNTFWDAAAIRTPYGWDAEMRIPWTSLRFQENQGEAVMGITIWWFMSAKNEVAMFPLIPRNWGGMSMWKPSQTQKYRFRGVHSHKPIYLTPYVLGGYQQSRELNETETAYNAIRDPQIEAGLDLKYSLTSNLTLDLTANTDFAQVEADDQQVNLTRFSLFFPEKRQFFQERASIFDFSFENFNRLFYSRTIGINDDGDPVRIYGGARLQGRVNNHDIGFLSMQTEAPASGLHSENFSLLRVRRRAFNSFSYIGFIGTNRMDFRGDYNTTYGFDGIIRVAGDEYLTAKWAQSFEDGQPNDALSLDPARLYLRWERRRYDGLAYNLTFSRAGETWSPGMGFEERENFSSLQAGVSYGILPGEKSKILNWRAFVNGQVLRNNDTDTIETAYIEPGIEFDTKKGWRTTASLRPTHEYVPEAFDLGDVVVPAGEYDFTQFSAFVFSPWSGLFGFFGTLNAGGFYDGTLFSVILSPRYKVSSHFNLEGFYQFNRAKFSERHHEFSSHLGRLKLEYLASTKFSVAAFLQYNSLDKIFIPNVRLRYNPREGNDFYIVFNDLLNSDRQREWPHLPRSDSRAVLVKYTYTFVL